MNCFGAKSRILTILLVCLCSFSAMAQNSGTIQGTVTDAQGALIAGATVQALDQDKGVVARDATTNSDGIFVLQPLQPGTYTVKVQAKGMKNLRRANVSRKHLHSERFAL